MTKAERIFNATYEAVKANGKALDYVVCRENERIAKSTIKALRTCLFEEQEALHEVYFLSEKEYFDEVAILSDVEDTIDNTEEAVEAAKEARKQEREDAKCNFDLDAYNAMLAEAQAIAAQNAAEEQELIIETAADGMTTVRNRANSKKWEIVKADCGDYEVTYFVYYTFCGWRKVGESKMYTPNAVECQFGITLDEEAANDVGEIVSDAPTAEAATEEAEEAPTTEEAPMIANSFDEFVDKTSEAIREVLNNTEAGQQISKALLAGALKKNPNMTPDEWAQMKSQFMTFIFTMFVKENPQAMHELGTHVYNELRA